MRVYKLVHKKYKGDIVLGLPQSYRKSAGEKKLNEMFANMKPWKQAIPYYKKSKFAFISSSALISFLFLKDNLDEEELNDVFNNYEVVSFEINTWSAGLSKYLCTYFDDEVEEDTTEVYDLKTISSWTAKFIYQDPVPKEDIKRVKDSYYSTVKTYYN